MRGLLLLLPVLLATACATGGGMRAAGIPVIPIRPEDRVILGDLTTVRAVATAFDRVYVVYDTDLGIWQPLERRWLVPRRPTNPGLLRDVVAALVDPLDQSVWLATRSGWVRYSPESDIWERGLLPGTVEQFGIDPQDPIGGAWFRTSTGWYQQGRAGPAIPGTPPRGLRLAPTLADAYRDMPALRAFGPTLAIGPGLEPGRLTVAAPAASGQGWFVGTSTRGLLYVDQMGVTPTPLPLGIGGEAVGALLWVGDGLWVSTDAAYRGEPVAVTFVEEELRQTVPLEGNGALGFPFTASRALLAGDRVLWLASDVGLVRLSLDGQAPQVWGEGSGLPIPRVTALAAWGDRIAVGTTRGLALREDGMLARAAPGVIDPIYALYARGDTLWVGGGFGLGAMLAGDSAVRLSTGWRQATAGEVPVFGIGYVADTLVAMTADRVLWRDPVLGGWTPGFALAPTLGRLRAMATTDAGVWVGGDRGAALVSLVAGPVRTLTVGRDLPAPVTALVATERYLWVGTHGGLVRLALVGF